MNQENVADAVVLTINSLDSHGFRALNVFNVAHLFFQRDPSFQYGGHRNGYDAWV